LAGEGKAPRIFFATRPVVLMLTSVLRSKSFLHFTEEEEEVVPPLFMWL
jgi:hypothetical protein